MSSEKQETSEERARVDLLVTIERDLFDAHEWATTNAIPDPVLLAVAYEDELGRKVLDALYPGELRVRRIETSLGTLNVKLVCLPMLSVLPLFDQVNPGIAERLRKPRRRGDEGRVVAVAFGGCTAVVFHPTPAGNA